MVDLPRMTTDNEALRPILTHNRPRHQYISSPVLARFMYVRIITDISGTDMKRF